MTHRLLDDAQTVRRVFRKVITIALLAVLFAAILLSVANDAYAFFKPQTSVRLYLTEPYTLSEFSRLLEQNGVLFHPYLFSLYVKSKEQAPVVESFYGELILDTAMSYREILRYVKTHPPFAENFSAPLE